MVSWALFRGVLNRGRILNQSLSVSTGFSFQCGFAPDIMLKGKRPWNWPLENMTSIRRLPYKLARVPYFIYCASNSFHQIPLSVKRARLGFNLGFVEMIESLFTFLFTFLHVLLCELSAIHLCQAGYFVLHAMVSCFSRTKRSAHSELCWWGRRSKNAASIASLIVGVCWAGLLPCSIHLQCSRSASGRDVKCHAKEVANCSHRGKKK